MSSKSNPYNSCIKPAAVKESAILSGFIPFSVLSSAYQIAQQYKRTGAAICRTSTFDDEIDLIAALWMNGYLSGVRTERKRKARRR